MENKEAQLWKRITELMSECSTRDFVIKILIITVFLLVIFLSVGSVGWYATKSECAYSREELKKIKKILSEQKSDYIIKCHQKSLLKS